MLWEMQKIDASHARRIGQPQSDPEYTDLCKTFPDPGAPATHEVLYRWESGPTKNHNRRIVFEPVIKDQPATPPLEAPQAAPAAPINVARRDELTNMSKEDFATTYGVAGLGTLPKNLSRAQAVAQVLEAEAKK